VNYNEDEPIPYTLDHIIIMAFPFILTDVGEIAVAHYVECPHCKLSYPAYINMSYVIDDFLPQGICINCNGEGLAVITYLLLADPE
jgi:hypothetical protein